MKKEFAQSVNNPPHRFKSEWSWLYHWIISSPAQEHLGCLPSSRECRSGTPYKGLTEIRSLKMTTDKSTRNIRFLHQLGQYLSENILWMCNSKYFRCKLVNTICFPLLRKYISISQCSAEKQKLQGIQVQRFILRNWLIQLCGLLSLILAGQGRRLETHRRAVWQLESEGIQRQNSFFLRGPVPFS